jgi:predicted unusual protein kinase regulating ubiquinone biosynthesis (AarF/ABC1/UbiB family)
MALNITLAEFNRLASGNYNAGQLDIQKDAHGNDVIVKVNNHRWSTSKNNVVIGPDKILAVKEAFLAALRRGGVDDEAMNEIRDRLGLPAELELLTDPEQRAAMLRARFAPLTRAQVRTILDEYANGGRGRTRAAQQNMNYDDYRAGQATANMSARKAAIQQRINTAAQNLHDNVMTGGGKAVDYGMSDVLSFLCTTRSLENLSQARIRRFGDAVTDADKRNVHTMMVEEFSGLFHAAFKLMNAADARESESFHLGGLQVKMARGEDGKLTALVGTGELQTKVELKMDAPTLTNYLIGRMVLDKETLGAQAVKNLLNTIYDHDLDGGLLANDRVSLTRHVAALIIAHGSGVPMQNIVAGNYNTGLLMDIAEAMLGGEVVNGAEALKAYHDRLVRDSAELPEAIKGLLEGVANVPLEKNIDGSFEVKPAIVAQMREVANVPPVPPMPYNAPLGGVSLDAIKNFVADLVFSDDTMVADVVVNRPGETMRKMLSTPERLQVFAAIMKDPTVLERAVAPQIANVVKEGFAKMTAIFDAAWQAANNGETFAQAVAKNDFAARFVAFFQNAEQLHGTEIAKFDNILQAMANKGCEAIQSFINSIFKIQVGQANALGALTTEPYKNMTAEQIKAQLDGKNLNQILDAASNSDVPGQVGFFKQVLSTYFTTLSKADKRSAFAAAMRYAQNFDLGFLEGEAREEANKIALNKFTGAILKGAGPLLQKMMQGLPRDIMGEFSDALNDMKSSLAPIPRKIVQGYLMQLVNESNGRIRAIKLEKSLGAASVGETFLCTVKVFTGQVPQQERYQAQDGRYLYRNAVDENGNVVMEDSFEDKKVVIKIMRHDAERRVQAEAEIFKAAAAKIPGMSKTWEGQYRQYAQEFDFTHEAANITEGIELYDIGRGKNQDLEAIAPRVNSMHISDLAAPKKDILVLEHLLGWPVDKYFTDNINEVRKNVEFLYEQAPGSNRIKWKKVEGKAQPIPVVKNNFTLRSLSNARGWVAAKQDSLCNVQRNLLQASKAWFYEALFGSGKFHGDTHSGNLMTTNANVTFIDFGNLYKLQERNEGGHNEKHELLRVIMGATFRDKSFVMEGFHNLLSAEGRAAFEANRPKIEAILDSVLAKGGFSQDIVYRLNASIAELQKLGMELPPQINCFVQSMMRMANTVTEMNTMIKQMLGLMDPSAWRREGPAPQRDDLDLLGRIFDVYGNIANQNIDMSKYNGQLPGLREFLSQEEFGGQNVVASEYFNPGHPYHTRVIERLTNAEDPVQTATNLVNMVTATLSPVEAHDFYDDEARTKSSDVLKNFREAMAAANTPEEKNAAIVAFADKYSRIVKECVRVVHQDEDAVYTNNLRSPLTFASALMELLLDHSDRDTLGTIFSAKDTAKLMADVAKIGKELPNASFFDFFSSSILDKLKEDAQNASSDKDSSYKIDIGV